MTDSGFAPRIYFATIAVEANRWTASRKPSIAASHWIRKALADGFHGVELWENHYAQAPSPEKQRVVDLCSHSNAGCILNSYHVFDSPETSIEPTEATLEVPAIPPPASVRNMLRELAATGIKFNLGTESAQEEMYKQHLRQWLQRLDDDDGLQNPLLLCECHPGTIVETPEAAERIFAGPLLDNIRYIVHPLSLDHLMFSKWIETGRVAHAHIQARTAPLREIEHAADSVRRLAEAVPNISLSLEFPHSVGTVGENAELSYHAAVEDLVYLRELIGH